jgi:hypothetical protein
MFDYYLGYLTDAHHRPTHPVGRSLPWVDGELTPVQHYADMYSGTGLRGLDGTAWHHSHRLTIDSRAVAAGPTDNAATRCSTCAPPTATTCGGV